MIRQDASFNLPPVGKVCPPAVSPVCHLPFLPCRLLRVHFFRGKFPRSELSPKRILNASYLHPRPRHQAATFVWRSFWRSMCNAQQQDVLLFPPVPKAFHQFVPVTKSVQCAATWRGTGDSWQRRWFMKVNGRPSQKCPGDMGDGSWARLYAYVDRPGFDPGFHITEQFPDLEDPNNSSRVQSLVHS